MPLVHPNTSAFTWMDEYPPIYQRGKIRASYNDNLNGHALKEITHSGIIKDFIPLRQVILFSLLWLFRVFNALVIKTYFQPDEYWQSLEVANVLVYKFGYLTWEWRYGLRCIFHPLIFATGFRFMQVLGLDTVGMRLILPKIMQGTFAAFGDFWTYKLARRLFGRESGHWALFCSVASAWNFYVLPRTFSNSLETILTAGAFYYWPWSAKSKKDENLLIALTLAGVACSLRITNFLLWLILGINYLFRGYPISSTIIMDATIVAVPIAGAMVLLDSHFYGTLSFTAIKFLQFNIVESLSSFYGRNPWHYYLTQGLPLLTNTMLPFTFLGLYQFRNTSPSVLVFIVVLCYSLLAHKEARFIFPLLPLLFSLTGKALSSVNRRVKQVASVVFVVVNVILAFYVTQIHQSGVIAVIDGLREDANVTSLAVLMPCHSTAWQQQLQRPDINAWFLTCEPPLNVPMEERDGYMDEADVFYHDQVAFINKTFKSTEEDSGRRDWPSHIIAFDALTNTVEPVFQEHGYRQCKRYFNSHWHEDKRRRGDVVVWCQEKKINQE